MSFTIERQREAARLCLPDGRLVERIVEIRRHPFTGETGRIVTPPLRPLRIPDIRKDYAYTAQGCPFCPEAVEKSTPRFSPDELEFPRMAQGEARVFPNLIAYSGACALTVLSEAHFVPLGELSEELLVNGLRAARAFFHACRDARPELAVRLLHWNYMPPAGSSMIHPHHQLMATETMPNRLRRLDAGSRRLSEACGENAWDQYVAMERAAGERWVGPLGPWSWTTDPVPQGRYFEVLGIHESKADVADLADRDFVPLAQGLRRVFDYLQSQGFWSFNLALMGAPDAEAHFRCQVRLVPRAFFPPAECADIHFDVLESEPIALRAPEDAARELGAFFG